MTKELLNQFQGKENVWHIISDNGIDCWLTQEVSFADETCAKGACKLNTVENETKHVLFLFNDKNEEVGRYYIGKKLQGKTPEQITELKGQICFFESWNPSTKSWVPCIGFSSKERSKRGICKEGCSRITIFRDGHYYVIDMQGNIIVPPGKYDYIDGFDKCGLARVKIDGKEDISNPENSTKDRWGIIDTKGTEVLPVKYDAVWAFYNKNRKSTRVMDTELEMLHGNYPILHKIGYDFYLETRNLQRLGYYINGGFHVHPYIDSEDQYSVWDALEDEPEVAGNIDYEW